MEIQSLYHMLNRSEGSGHREYIDVRSKSLKSLGIKHKKRESFFQELQRQSKKIPGPGRYTINPQQKNRKQKIVQRINFQKLANQPKKDYVEELLRQKKFIPGVGNYELIKDKSEQIRKKYEALGDKARKEAPLFKNTIFDYHPVDCLNVDPGTYDSLKPFGQKSSFRNEPIIAKSGDKDALLNKRSMSLPKLPHPQSYTPIPMEYQTFDRMESRSHTKSSPYHESFTKQQRFKKDKQMGPGPKYSLIAQWARKDKYSEVHNVFKSTSSPRHPGVYH